MLRIGILGATETTVDAICAPALRRSDIALKAIAARNRKAATDFAQKHKIEHVEQDYESVLNRADVDLIYIPLIPSLHVQWVVRALNAGKHVLVEKPAALSSDEVAQMQDAAQANNVRLIEAFHHRYHPAYQQFLRLIEANHLGRLKYVHVQATTPIHFDPNSFRHQPSLGGGALSDIGCYPVFWLRDIVGDNWEALRVEVDFHKTGIDETVRVSARSAIGTKLSLFTSMAQNMADEAHIYIEGERGSLKFSNPLAPHNGHCLDLTIDGVRRRFTVAGETTYEHQLSRLIAGLEHGHQLPTEGEAIAKQMAVMERLVRAGGISYACPASAFDRQIVMIA
jgi:predicted dehydrogenase